MEPMPEGMSTRNARNHQWKSALDGRLGMPKLGGN
jgi:hypothetical protein